MKREPIFGHNAKAFAIQFAFLLLFIFLLAGPLRGFFGNVLCDGIGFCSTEMERQRAIETNRASERQQ